MSTQPPLHAKPWVPSEYHAGYQVPFPGKQSLHYKLAKCLHSQNFNAIRIKN